MALRMENDGFGEKEKAAGNIAAALWPVIKL
jgi:hypothetical protein